MPPMASCIPRFVALCICCSISVDLVIGMLIASELNTFFPPVAIAQLAAFSEIREKPCPGQTVAVSCTSSGNIVWANNNQSLFIFEEGDNDPQTSASGKINSGIVYINGSERTSILFVEFQSTDFSLFCNTNRIQVQFSGSHVL